MHRAYSCRFMHYDTLNNTYNSKPGMAVTEN